MALLTPINALGTQFLIEIWDDVREETLESARTRLELLLSQFESNYSRFKPDSYISLLNRNKHIDNPPPELVTLLNMGITMYDQTRGIHNLMVGETLINNGYDTNYSFQAKQSLVEIPNPHEVLTITNEQITLNRGQIDIGGYGKGVVIDLLASILKDEFALQYFLINGGGDMYGTTQNGLPITLYLEHPTEANTYLGTVQILNQGFAASSPHKRTWVHADTTYHHIIDTTGNQKFQSKPDASFITCHSAVHADIFATVALLVETDTMLQFAENYELGVATFALPATIHTNQAFNLQSLS